HRSTVWANHKFLPSIAAEALDAKRFVSVEMPLLRGYERNICLAWNPRLLQLRPLLQKTIVALESELTSQPPEAIR
ncbi:MAG TPA: hypothetical protein VG146_16055, partial [Verrucomicrobiae bacterium]|nr:hypothetical protein [Verrucomicrobiae bacterium]